MTFLHVYVLGGLVLAGLPVLLHLIMRQKPKRQRFPAFRFLKARQRTNQRKLQLQHLLLLLLRILVLVALCLALARPRLFSNGLTTTRVGDRPVVAVLLLDTSMSMEYGVAGVSRLDEGKRRAKELIAEMKPESRVAIDDGGDTPPDALLPLTEAGVRLDRLRLRPSGGPLNGAVDRALRLLEKQPDDEDAPPRLLYVFSDRTRACWDPTGLKPRIPAGVQVTFVDVGVEAPKDLGIEKIEVIPPVVAPGARYEVRVSVRASDEGHENELTCLVDNDPATDRRLVRLAKGVTADVIAFDRVAPTPPAGRVGEMPYQLTVRLGTRDALPYNNVRHATFHVLAGKKLLTLVNVNDPVRQNVWTAAHAATHSFDCQIKTFAEADKLTTQDLAGYAVITLFQATAVPDGWWPKLTAHVTAGGGLAIVPAGEEALDGLTAFNAAATKFGLLPAPLTTLASAPPGKPVVWASFTGQHPLLAPFVAWMRGVDPDFARDDLRPFVRRYWKLGRLEKGALTITAYADADKSPALVERPVGKGRVVLFTTPLDFRFVDERRILGWNNYIDSSFGLVLIDRVCRYLGGEVSTPLVNFACGAIAQVAVPGSPEPPLALVGPGLTGAERTLGAPDVDGVLRVPQAQAAGNFQVNDGKGKLLAGFTLDVASREGNLERVGLEELEEAFGKNSVVTADRTVSLVDVLSGSQPPPLELLPYLMMLVLLILTGESFLANRFYRRVPGGEEAT